MSGPVATSFSGPLSTGDESFLDELRAIQTDCDAFQHKDGGIDGFEVEELDAEAGR